MASVIDVAKYILEKAGKMSTFKLQKLVYYSQAWSLVWDEAPLFQEEIEAWANGPVVPALFSIHKGLFIVDSTQISGNSSNLKDNEKDTIDVVLRDYGNFTGGQLCEIVHGERPWIEARDGAPSGAICTDIISLETMQDFYSGLLASQSFEE